MEPRLDYSKVDPAAFHAILGMEKHLHTASGLEPQLIHLVKLRASQMNGCAYCVDMHVKEARKDGLVSSGWRWSASGARRGFLRRASVPFWPGPRP